MKLLLLLVTIVVTIYLIVYKYQDLETIPEMSHVNQELRKKDNHSFLDSKHSMLVTLNNIEISDKVTIGNVQEKWSLNKHIIDADLNKQVVCFLSKTIDTLGIFSSNDYHLHTIENIYVMKDSDRNFRIVGDAFIQDIKSYFSIRLTFDFVSLGDDVYINYIDIDESSVNNLLDRYNVKWRSQGILNDFHSFDMNVVTLLDNHYKSNTKLFKVTRDTRDEDLLRTTRLVKFYSSPDTPSVEFPMFCKKNTGRWNYRGDALPTTNYCMFHNPYSTPYPNDPYFAPGVVTTRTDTNDYDWMKNPARGNHLRE